MKSRTQAQNRNHLNTDTMDWLKSGRGESSRVPVDWAVNRMVSCSDRSRAGVEEGMTPSSLSRSDSTWRFACILDTVL